MDKEKTVGYILNFGADLGNGRQLTVGFNLATGCSSEEFNEAVDKIRLVIDRQQAKSALRGAQEEVDVLEMRKRAATSDLESIDSAHAAKGGPSSNEREQRKNAVVHIERMGQDIEYKKGIVAKLLEESK